MSRCAKRRDPVQTAGDQGSRGINVGYRRLSDAADAAAAWIRRHDYGPPRTFRAANRMI
jgi:hypothetical protein